MNSSKERKEMWSTQDASKQAVKRLNREVYITAKHPSRLRGETVLIGRIAFTQAKLLYHLSILGSIELIKDEEISAIMNKSLKKALSF
jgi:hypothetical protein